MLCGGFQRYTQFGSSKLSAPATATTITAAYTATMVQSADSGNGVHTTDEGVIGITTTGKYTVGGAGAGAVYVSAPRGPLHGGSLCEGRSTGGRFTRAAPRGVRRSF